MDRIENENKKQYKTEFIEMYGMRAWKERNHGRRVSKDFDTGVGRKKSHGDYSRANSKRYCHELLQEW